MEVSRFYILPAELYFQIKISMKVREEWRKERGV